LNCENRYPAMRSPGDFETAPKGGLTMAIRNDEVISTLNNLIETCRDGQHGFQSAASGVKDPALKSLFEQYGLQRAKFVGELQYEVLRLGGDPENTGSVAAALHRGWIDIKSAVTGKNEHAILAECERGEDSAIKNYQEALKKPLPSDLAQIVERQYEMIREAHSRVRGLCDRARASGA
jgi:uncharacterized protein (TIGR02284 family)